MEKFSSLVTSTFLIQFLFLFYFFVSSCTSGGLKQKNALNEATNTLEKIRKNGVLRVGTTGDYRPFTYRSTDGTYSGFDIGLAQELASKLGLKLELVQTSWKSMASDLLKGNFDIAMGGISITDERQSIGFLTKEYLVTGKSAISRCKDRNKYRSLEAIDRPEVKVIVNPGGTNEKFVKSNLRQAPISVFPDNNTIFDQISEGQADVMITDSSEIDLIAGINKKLCATTPGKTFDRFGKGYFMLKDKEWNQFVDTWITELVQNRTIEKKYKAALEDFKNKK